MFRLALRLSWNVRPSKKKKIKCLSAPAYIKLSETGFSRAHLKRSYREKKKYIKIKSRATDQTQRVWRWPNRTESYHAVLVSVGNITLRQSKTSTLHLSDYHLLYTTNMYVYIFSFIFYCHDLLAFFFFTDWLWPFFCVCGKNVIR